jgi:hypothetical protein
MLYLTVHEFSTPEKQEKFGIQVMILYFFRSIVFPIFSFGLIGTMEFFYSMAAIWLSII